MYTCLDVANYFLSLNDEEAGDLMSNLKVQKLIYYAQGFSLAVLGKPMFADPIEAWAHGPVVSSLYHRYKEYGAGPIPVPEGFDPSIFEAADRELLDEVYSVFGQFSAWKLRNMTHEEPPWREKKVSGGVITHESMTRYFVTQVEG